MKTNYGGIVLAWLATAMILTACGGGGGGSPAPAGGSNPATTYRATNGVAQKGPLLLGSTVTAQELSATLVPTGKQYTYQINSDLGTFSPTSTFSSAYIDLNASGYYFDEVTNAVSTGTVVLNGLNVLSSDTVLNVNLLTTLAYQRTKMLMTGGMTFLVARSQAEREVLAVFHIGDGNQYGNFGTLDLSKRRDGDNILAAISSMFVFGNNAGNMSALIANFQTDIAANGNITNAATVTALGSSAKNLNPATVATNLTAKYSSLGLTILPTDISNWLDQDGDGVIGKFKFEAVQPPAATPYAFPAYTVGESDNGAVYTITNGQFTVNGGAPTSSATVATGNTIVVVRTPTAYDASSVYLQSGTLKVARYNFNPFALAESLITGRAGVTATVLPNGKVLAVGGSGIGSNGLLTDLSSAELYDPASNLWSAAASLSVARSGHTATLLNNGNVLVNGGTSGWRVAELYDAATNTWSSAGVPTNAYMGHTATLLPNGKVLVVGGRNPLMTYSSYPTRAELYDPVANAWIAVPNMNTTGGRYYHTATLLQNGKVLVAGGMQYLELFTDTAELFDPALNTWTTVGSLLAASHSHTATLLSNGKVLVSGVTAQLFDPATNTWSVAARMSNSRAEHIAQLLNTGAVLIAGGRNLSCTPTTISCQAILPSAELYDPASNTWVGVGKMAYERSGFAAAMLNNGKVLMVGGSGSQGGNLKVTESF